MGKRGKVINPKSFSRNRGVASDDMDDEIDACKQSSFSVSFFSFWFCFAFIPLPILLVGLLLNSSKVRIQTIKING